MIARGESVHQLHNEEEFPSGQREQTVNLSLFSFGGSNPPSSTKRGSVELFFIKNEFALVYRFGDAL